MNVWKIIYLNCGEICEDIDYHSYSHNLQVKFKPEKNAGLNGIRTHDLCNIGAVLYQLSYWAK